MKVPKYIQDIMSRSEFAIGYGDPGYTIEITKATPYTKVETLQMEIGRLQKWVEREMPDYDWEIPTMIINRLPNTTRYGRQYAVVTIYDPIMRCLEKYMVKHTN